MTKLASRTHIPARWTQGELAPITQHDHLLLAHLLIAALDQDRQERDLSLGPLGKPALEHFRRCVQFTCNDVGDDTGGVVAP